VKNERFGAVVVGGGLAGMLTALELRPLSVALVSYRALGELTSSAWAQGGIAAAVGDDDSPSLHAADTVRAGAGLVERHVAARLAADAPEAIERIASLGVQFDRDAASEYSLGREAAHSRRRILRAGGDATGAELVRAMAEGVRHAPTIVPFEGARALDIVTSDGRVCAVVVRNAEGALERLTTDAVILATGGIGGLYSHTTNPRASVGAGIAIAARAGARLEDLEFVQFHPTALDVPSDPLPLVTEALRGEGAKLVDAAGRRIMEGIDPALELASRDVVARRAFAVRVAGERVFLDARALGESLPKRFPTVFAACMAHGIDPRLEPIPVVAAAHYHMGGVAIDLEGRTSVPGLYACGEVAATGVHGANRLASNSLLESVVYPERIARDVKTHARAERGIAGTDDKAIATRPYVAGRDDEWRAVRREMYANVGVERDEAGLGHALAAFRALAETTPSDEVRDAATTAALIAQSALRRRETRGSHVRLDYPGSALHSEHSFATLADLVPSA
jgi:L-aspartate oxidase